MADYGISSFSMWGVYSALGAPKNQMIQLRLLFLSLFVRHTTTRDRHISRLHTSTDHLAQPRPQMRSALSVIDWSPSAGILIKLLFARPHQF